MIFTAVISESVLAKIKHMEGASYVRAGGKPADVFSANDALFAFMLNAIGGLKVGMYPMDVRGKVNFLPLDAIGNAECVCFFRPSHPSAESIRSRCFPLSCECIPRSKIVRSRCLPLSPVRLSIIP